MNSGNIRVLGISGSLRKGSYNTAALRAAQELAPEGMIIDTAAIATCHIMTTISAPLATRRRWLGFGRRSRRPTPSYS
jgi:hypothetical protein